MAVTAHHLRNTVNNAFFLRSAGVSQEAQSNLQETLDRQTRDLGNVAYEMGRSATLEETGFQEKAVRLLRDAPVYSAIAFLNESLKRHWVFPFTSSRITQGTTLTNPSEEWAAAHRSARTGEPAASGLLDLMEGGRGILLYAPVQYGGKWTGLLEGSVQIARVALDLISPTVGQDFHYTIIDERQGREIYASSSSRVKNVSPAYDSYFSLPVADRTWWVLLHPQAPPPTLAIVVGALCAEGFLGFLIYYLWRKRK